MVSLKECKELFEADTLYEVLEIDKKANCEKIKKAYKKMSLKVHPDRHPVEEKELCTTKFQVLSQVVKILLDKERRELYDQTGVLNYEECNLDWSNFFKGFFKFDVNDFNEYRDEYLESELETIDLINNYKKHKGNLDLVFECHKFFEIEHEDRLRKILDEAIDKNEIPAFDAYVNETKRKRNRRKKFYLKEKEEVEKMNSEKEAENSFEALALKIRERHAQSSDDFIKRLETKYAPPAKKKKVAASTSNKKVSVSSSKKKRRK